MADVLGRWVEAFWVPDPVGMMEPWRWREASLVRMIEGFDPFAPDVDEQTRDCVFAVMAVATHHRFFVATGYADALQAYVSDPGVTARIQRMSAEMLNVARLNGPVYAGAAQGMPLTKWPLPNVRLYCTVAEWCDPWGVVPQGFRLGGWPREAVGRG